MAKVLEKCLGLYKVGTALTSRVKYEINSVPRDILLSDMGFADDDWISLPALAAGFNTFTASDHTSDLMTMSLNTTSHKLQIVTAHATFTLSNYKVWTDGTIGGTLANWTGHGASGVEAIGGGSKTMTATNLSSKLYLPDDTVLKDDTPVVDIQSSGTVADSGKVTTTYFGYNVTKRTVTFLMPHDETWILGQSDDTDANTGNLETQFKLWAQGEPFAVHKNRADNTMYNTSTPNLDGYRVYRLDPAGEYRFAPNRVIPGVDLYWEFMVPMIEIDDTDWIDETEV